MKYSTFSPILGTLLLALGLGSCGDSGSSDNHGSAGAGGTANGGAAGSGGTPEGGIEDGANPTNACGDDPNGAAPLVLGGPGASGLTIVIPADASSQLKRAATELRDDIELATGTTLEIVRDDAASAPAGNIISLGATKQAQAAGFSAKNLEFDAFRIVRKDNDLFIYGQDDLEDPLVVQSFGTVNGVHVFLESCLDVRWLLPGPTYKDVPERKTFEIGAIDKIVTPRFKNRVIHEFIIDGFVYNHFYDWTRQLRFHGENPRFTVGSHSWGRIAGAHVLPDESHPNSRLAGVDLPVSEMSCDELNKERSFSASLAYIHSRKPEWFAMISPSKPTVEEQRELPSNLDYFKLETTNEEVVQVFADLTVRTWQCTEDKYKAQAISLSPSDGASFSLSPESKAYIAPPYDAELLEGWDNHTPLILKWYRDVSQKVLEKEPTIQMAGMLYGFYAFPPPSPKDILPDPANFSVVYVDRAQSYSHLFEQTSKLIDLMANGWTGITKRGWAWGYPTRFLGLAPTAGTESKFTKPAATSNILTPSGVDILGRLVKNHAKMDLDGIVYKGESAFANTGLQTYLTGRLLWDPTLDAEVERVDWTRRMFGEDTAVFIRIIDDRVTEWFRSCLIANGSAWPAELSALQCLYVPNFPELEDLVLQAQAQSRTAIQQERFQMFLANVTIMRWRFDKAGLTKNIAPTKLDTSDDNIDAIFAVDDPNISRYMGYPAGGGYRDTHVYHAEFVEDGVIDVRESAGYWANSVLIIPRQDGEITIDVDRAEQNGLFTVGYGLFEIANPEPSGLHKLVPPTLLRKGRSIKFDGKKGSYYVLSLGYSQDNPFKITINNARAFKYAAYDGRFATRTLRVNGPSEAPLIIYHDPAQTEDFTMTDDADNMRVSLSYEP